MMAPITGPTSGALKKSERKDKALCARGESWFHLFFEKT
jgi:hypothetical protein